MEKTIYEIRKADVEYREMEFRYVEGDATDKDEDPLIKKTFDTLEEAKAYFSKCESSISYSKSCVFDLVNITEYSLWKANIELDEDGEIDCYLDGEILDIAPMEPDKKLFAHILPYACYDSLENIFKEYYGGKFFIIRQGCSTEYELFLEDGERLELLPSELLDAIEENDLLDGFLDWLTENKQIRDVNLPHL